MVASIENCIETPYELKECLGYHFEHIKCLDPLECERIRTKQLRKKLIKKYGKKCAICDMNSDIVAAHIVPLEIGAKTTEENLVLLCFNCHDFYDKGYMSINAMKKLAEKWRKRERIEFSCLSIDSTKQSSVDMIPLPKSVQVIMEQVRELQYKKHYCKGISVMEAALKGGNLDGEERLYLSIKCAELTRRRAAQKVAIKASEILEKINLEELFNRYHSVYYYELAYTYRLRGDHSKAAQIIRLSAEASKKKEQDEISSLEYISASVIEILCLLAARETLSPQEVEDFVGRLHELELMAMKHGGYWGGRWALNCAAHRLEVYLKNRDREKCWETLQQVRDLYYDSDRSNGWDAASKQTISLLEGLTRVFFPKDKVDLDIGIGLLARAFVTRTGPQQRPEGIRDVGFGLVEGCRKAECKLPKKTLETIERIMNQCIDGTSILWPWRVNNDSPHQPLPQRHASYNIIIKM